MKKFFSVLLVIAVSIAISSCAAFKKPAPPQNKTFIVPEVSRVSFDTIDLKKSPKVVRDMAKSIENQDSIAWTQVGNSAYIVVSRGEKTKYYDITVEEILRRLPEENYTWIDAKLKYKKRDKPETDANKLFTVVKADLDTPPNGAGFTISGLETGGITTVPGRSAPNTATPNSTAPNLTTQNIQTGTVIEQPASSQVITSPVRIKGISKSPGKKRVRLSTRGGQIIKEDNLNTDSSGSFDYNLSYNSPEMPAPGDISIIEYNGTDEKVLARVPVIIR
ncbi:MAG: hypothetical protein ACOY46_11100 [Bacillota bacterium]